MYIIMELLYKHIIKDFFSKKTLIGILSLLFVFIAFMYYFVHFSIDKNLVLFNEMQAAEGLLSDNKEKYYIALQNNYILIRNITLAMVGVISLILFFLIRNVMNKSQVKIGHLQTLGFLLTDVVNVYVLIIIGLSFSCSLIGLCLGYFGSNYLIMANKQTYLVDSILKGINFKSFMIGTIFVTVFLGIITYIAGISVKKSDVALMLKHITKADIRLGIIERLIQKLPIRNKFRFKLTMKNISAIALLIVAIVTFNIMFILSVSLIFSGNKIINSQTTGRHYLYDISYNCYNNDASAYDDEAIPYIKYEVDIEIAHKTVKYNIVGIDKLSELFELVDNKGRQIAISDGIILNPELKENYGVKIGDIIYINIEGNKYKVRVAAIAENAALKTVYLSKKQVAEMIQQDNNSFNGILTNQLLKDGDELVSIDEEISAIEKSLTSNKASAIINQSIGVITGCLLIYLAIFIGLTNSMNSILIFDLLGYRRHEINKILLNPYIIVSNLLFLFTFPISAYVAKKIQIMTSIATNDYMPFKINIVTFIYMLIILNILCLGVRALFTKKVKKVISAEQQAEFLYEW